MPIYINGQPAVDSEQRPPCPESPDTPTAAATRRRRRRRSEINERTRAHRYVARGGAHARTAGTQGRPGKSRAQAHRDVWAGWVCVIMVLRFRFAGVFMVVSK